jgi:hypothetical protein
MPCLSTISLNSKSCDILCSCTGLLRSHDAACSSDISSGGAIGTSFATSSNSLTNFVLRGSLMTTEQGAHSMGTERQSK